MGWSEVTRYVLARFGYEKTSEKRVTTELLPTSSYPHICGRCGCDRVMVVSREPGDIDSWPSRRFTGLATDHLELRCPRCAHMWAEHTRDSIVIDV